MFVNIDYNKRQKKAKFHLAKPNKQIISHISEKFRDKLSLKLGNINELEFSIPHSIIDESTGELFSNPHVELIKERMLIRVTLDTYKEWYIVDSIDEDGDDSEIFNVKAFSLGKELSDKRVSGLTEESINASSLLTELLETSVWSVGTVENIFDEMFRSFDSGDDSNILDCIINAGETFGALIQWDTENRKVSFLDMSQHGKFRGMSVNYGKFLRSIRRTRTTDEMVTRLYVYGSEDTSIYNANPTGMPYIEDFSYFMYPFSRDGNRNVIKSSHFMSDDLCHAILDHEKIVSDNASTIDSLTEYLTSKQTTLVTYESEMVDLNNQLETILELLDTAKAVLANATIQADIDNAQAVVNQRVQERDDKEDEIILKQEQIDYTKNEITSIQNDINSRQDLFDNMFTPQLKDELSLYIIEKEWRDDRYIDEFELYTDALKKFEEIRQPKVVIEVSIDNLMNIIEEQYYWDKLVLGDLIKVKYPQMNIEYMAKIIEINYDLENGEAELTIANTTDLLSETDKLVQLLYTNSSASTLIQNNKYKWNKINAVSEQVSSLLTDEWDATKQKIIAGVRNSVEVGNRGIIIRNPDYPDEIVIMQSGVIALSKDSGETWKTAIKPDGIVAERLIGKVIAGQELIITNSSGSFTFDNNGVRINASAFVVESGSGTNMVDKWTNSSDFVDEYTDDNIITAYEKKMLKIEWSKILQSYNANVTKINNFYEDDGASLEFVQAYHTRYTELYDYLFVTIHGDKPLLAEDNLTVSTRVDSTTYKLKFGNYETSKIELEKQLDLMALQLSSEAKESASNAEDLINEIADDIVYKTELHSTSGNVFNNGNINTTLYVKVYRGKDDITATLPNEAFIWKKSDKNGNMDNAWNNAHIGVGHTVNVTYADVDRKAVFWCDIDIV